MGKCNSVLEMLLSFPSPGAKPFLLPKELNADKTLMEKFNQVTHFSKSVTEEKIQAVMTTAFEYAINPGQGPGMEMSPWELIDSMPMGASFFPEGCGV